MTESNKLLSQPYVPYKLVTNRLYVYNSDKMVVYGIYRLNTYGPYRICFVYGRNILYWLFMKEINWLLTT